MALQVELVESDAQLDAISTVLLQLRPSFTKDALIAQIKEQQKSGYRLAYVVADGTVLCVAGFVVGLKLAWGKHLYVDDLVTDERYRSSGAGAYLLEWLQSYAREHGCGQMHLDSGVQRFAAHRFYLRHGFNITSHHFAWVPAS